MMLRLHDQPPEKTDPCQGSCLQGPPQSSCKISKTFGETSRGQWEISEILAHTHTHTHTHTHRHPAFGTSWYSHIFDALTFSVCNKACRTLEMGQTWNHRCPKIYTYTYTPKFPWAKPSKMDHLNAIDISQKLETSIIYARWAPYELSAGAHSSFYRGEITPGKPMYFWPFIGISLLYSIYN